MVDENVHVYGYIVPIYTSLLFMLKASVDLFLYVKYIVDFFNVVKFMYTYNVSGAIDLEKV